jgi:hypothetical protein
MHCSKSWKCPFLGPAHAFQDEFAIALHLPPSANVTLSYTNFLSTTQLFLSMVYHPQLEVCIVASRGREDIPITATHI